MTFSIIPLIVQDASHCDLNVHERHTHGADPARPSWQITWSWLQTTTAKKTSQDVHYQYGRFSLFSLLFTSLNQSSGHIPLWEPLLQATFWNSVIYLAWQVIQQLYIHQLKLNIQKSQWAKETKHCVNFTVAQQPKVPFPYSNNASDPPGDIKDKATK